MASNSSKALSKSGTLFFSSLCAGTFGLGSWQSKRYFEKIEQVEQRKHDLKMDPIPYSDGTDNIDNNDLTTTNPSFRRYKMKGTFRHEDQIFVGPRGPPLDALGKSGPMSGRSGGGMGVSPQGYFIITPFEREDNNDKNVILVNRGWVPQHYVKQSIAWENNNIKGDSSSSSAVEITGVKSRPETPAFFVPKQSTKTKDNTLLWMEEEALRNATNTNTNIIPQKDKIYNEVNNRQPLLLFVETGDDNDAMENGDGSKKIISFPVKPNAETVGEFKVMPFTHATYAFTWFGLSTAGVFMTRKLITKGR